MIAQHFPAIAELGYRETRLPALFGGVMAAWYELAI